MKSLKNILFATCALGFTASDSSANDSKVAQTWREIGSGTYSAIEEATQLVIRDSKVWNEWWRKHTQNIHDTAQPDGIKPPDVDFKTETVLIVTLGMHSTGGHSVRFTDVKREGDCLTAVLARKSPGPDDMVTMALTYPFAIIAVPKHEGRVEFSFE